MKKQPRRYGSLVSLIQIKPLTEEEKKAKLEDLKAKMLVRKAEQAKKEREADKANEVYPFKGLMVVDSTEARSRFGVFN